MLIFCHGLESSPKGHKAIWLKERYGGLTPRLKTQETRDFFRIRKERKIGNKDEQGWRQELRLNARTVASTLCAGTKLLIGSSYGGAVVCEMISLGLWTGPVLLLASAHVQLSTLRKFRSHSLCIHGTRDDTIPPEPVHKFCLQSGPKHEFWLIDDDHRLSTILTNGLLESAIGRIISKKANLTDISTSHLSETPPH